MIFEQALIATSDFWEPQSALSALPAAPSWLSSA
jgi:hypothetical protein